MFDEDIEKPSQPMGPKNLETMSVDELENYIGELEAEIVHVTEEIGNKKGHMDVASSVFKN